MGWMYLEWLNSGFTSVKFMKMIGALTRALAKILKLPIICSSKMV